MLEQDAEKIKYLERFVTSMPLCCVVDERDIASPYYFIIRTTEEGESVVVQKEVNVAVCKEHAAAIPFTEVHHSREGIDDVVYLIAEGRGWTPGQKYVELLDGKAKPDMTKPAYIGYHTLNAYLPKAAQRLGEIYFKVITAGH